MANNTQPPNCCLVVALPQHMPAQLTAPESKIAGQQWQQNALRPTAEPADPASHGEWRARQRA